MSIFLVLFSFDQIGIYVILRSQLFKKKVYTHVINNFKHNARLNSSFQIPPQRRRAPRSEFKKNNNASLTGFYDDASIFFPNSTLLICTQFEESEPFLKYRFVQGFAMVAQLPRVVGTNNSIFSLAVKGQTLRIVSLNSTSA